MDFGTREHYPLFKHIADTCDMTIITSGVPSSTKVAEFEKSSTKKIMNKRPFASFACTSHKDKCDELCNKCKDHFIKNFNDSQYIDDLTQLVGCGLPTTCEYKHIWQNENAVLD